MRDKIKIALKNITEAAAVGLDTTQKIQKKEKSVNQEYYKDVEKKMKAYDKSSKEDDKEAITPPKFDAEGEEKKYHDEMEIRNGQEMLQYDRDPNETFKKRAEMAIKGDSKMGNAVKTGKWNPKTGEGNGNTESVWGASKDNFGEELIKTIKDSAKKRQDAKQTITQFGDDIELSDRSPIKKKVAVEQIENNKVEIKKTMKRLTFNKPFGGIGNALKLIPEHYRVDNKTFQMTDGDELYTIRWEGNLSEGRPVVVTGSSKKMVNEDLQKMKHLMGYDSSKTLGVVKGQNRLDENKSFNKIWDLSKQMVSEGEKSENSETISENFKNSILYKSATWKPLTESKEEMETVEETESKEMENKENTSKKVKDVKKESVKETTEEDNLKMESINITEVEDLTEVEIAEINLTEGIAEIWDSIINALGGWETVSVGGESIPKGVASLIMILVGGGIGTMAASYAGVGKKIRAFISRIFGGRQDKALKFVQKKYGLSDQQINDLKMQSNQKSGQNSEPKI